MNIVDIGSGKYKEYTKWLSIFPSLKIYAIEPLPENFKKLQQLKQQLLENSSKRLFLIECAISDVNGIFPFNVNNDQSSGSLLKLSPSGVKKWRYPIGRRYLKTLKTINVKTMTLTSFLEKYKISSIELLNIDTQGDSLAILNSLNAKYFFQHKTNLC